MDTVKNKQVRLLKSMNPWHFLWISVVLSELLALAVTSIQGFIRWGSVSYELLGIIAIDAFFVPLVVALILIYFLIKNEEARTINERMSDIIEFLPDAVFAVNNDKKVIAWNRAVEEMTGIGKEDMLDRGVDAYAHAFRETSGSSSSLADLVSMPLKMTGGTGDSAERRGRVFSAEGFAGNIYGGKGGYLSAVATPLLDRKGAVVGSIVILRDITKSRNAEEQLLHIAKGVSSATGEAFFRSLVDHMVKALGVDYAYVGKLSSEEENRRVLVIASNTAEKLPAGHEYDISGTPAESVVDKQACILYPGGVRQLFPHDVTLSEMDIESYAGAALCDSEGRVLGILVLLHRQPLQEEPHIRTILDIFAVRAAAELQRSNDEAEQEKMIAVHQKLFDLVSVSQKEWQDTFDRITDMILILDRDMTVRRANRAVEKILGMPFQQFLGKKCNELFQRAGEDPEECAGQQCMMTGKPVTAEMYEPRLKRFFEVTAIPRFSSNNDLTGLIHIFRDITEHKKFEEQLLHAQKMEAVGQLAGGIAHDFNNILTVILSSAQLLELKADRESPLRAYAEYIVDATKRGVDLVKGLLTFSRKNIVYPVSLDLNEIVEGVEPLIRRLIPEDIELQIRLADRDLPVRADKTQIEQILFNLVSNSRDAMPSGGLISISTEYAELYEDHIDIPADIRPGKYALLIICDSGTGMDEKTRDRIFDPFFTTKEVGKGTGLGLSSAYGIIKQHNGYIEVYSSPGIGTAVKVFLPLIPTLDEGTETGESALPKGGHETILFAEDESSVRGTTKELLEEFGYTVIAAVDGEDAVGLFRENKDAVRLLLLDVIMPKMNGKEVYEEIKMMRPDIKTIFMSGYSADILQSRFLIEDGLHYIAKPVSPVVLLKTIREVLDRGVRMEKGS